MASVDQAPTLSGPRGRDGNFRGRTSERGMVAVRPVSPNSSRSPGDIFVQKGREAVGHGHRNKEGRVMSARHFSCPACRIRVRADAPEITLLEDRCPICGAMLGPVTSASDVMGFRSFDLDSLSEQESDDQPNLPGNSAEFVAHREAAPARYDLDADRWSDDGGNITSEAVAAGGLNLARTALSLARTSASPAARPWRSAQRPTRDQSAPACR
jgi:hypothetical protein